MADRYRCYWMDFNIEFEDDDSDSWTALVVGERICFNRRFLSERGAIRAAKRVMRRRISLNFANELRLVRVAADGSEEPVPMPRLKGTSYPPLRLKWDKESTSERVMY